MKKIKFTGKLSLNKETVSKLNQEQMTRVLGGSVRCASAAPNCPDTTQTNCVTFVDSCDCYTNTCTLVTKNNCVLTDDCTAFGC